MKSINIIVYGLLVVIGLVSCKENFREEDEMGSFLISIEAKNPEKKSDDVASRLDNWSTDNFPVSITGKKGTSVENIGREFPTVSSLPKEPVLLPVGSYVVTSHTPGDLEKQMDYPYFAGTKDIDILKDITSTTKVVCKMQNSKIQLTYQDDFKETFTSWNITIDDGSGAVIAFDEKNLTPAPVYYHFGEKGVEFLTMNIRATTATGNSVVKVMRLYKTDADESYDGDTPNFVGGDGLNLTMKLDQDPEGSMVIKVDISILFTEHQDNVDVNVTDKEPVHPEIEEPFDPNEGDNGDDQGGDEQADDPTLELPADFTYSLSGNPAKPTAADAVFKTPNGLESAVVKISTDNADFHKTLQDAEFDTAGKLLSGAELIGNQAMQNLFAEVELKDESGQPKMTPVEGDTEYTFPLSAFFKFLDLFTGTHTFELTLTDKTGVTTSGTLTIQIVD